MSSHCFKAMYFFKKAYIIMYECRASSTTASTTCINARLLLHFNSVSRGVLNNMKFQFYYLCLVLKSPHILFPLFQLCCNYVFLPSPFPLLHFHLNYCQECISTVKSNYTHNQVVHSVTVEYAITIIDMKSSLNLQR